ncbi:metallophosphoesterase [Spongiibacter marinus]|uniref:metallophosphoesterase n=1 Tax=Spongiibacter marinus TaxID=354246 RepID=UPI001960AE3E|nr:metallophosphoesterase [Spongiibacter marinus]MBM7425043.1 3',5'-cyclic AMP phosphodiesterase CpdA [Spongiibacter marinus]
MKRFLHLSDLHFNYPDCMEPDQDRDGPIRDKMIEDIAQLIENDGIKLSAILVTGDIAYKGHKDEFTFAGQWLGELCEKFDCTASQVYVVPGNHDVDRSIADNFMTMGLRTGILSKSGERCERELQQILRDDEASSVLYRPMDAYNEFAATYGCHVKGIKAKWMESIEIDQGVNVVIHGLTTTLLCSKDDAKQNILLGEFQTVARAKTPHNIHLAMMHHPPSWLRNADAMKAKLDDAMDIQLTGHEHTSRWDDGNGVVRISAEALHPDRMESGYEPGYNLIDLKLVNQSQDKAELEVSTQIRVLQENPIVFRPKINKGGTERFVIRFPVQLPAVSAALSDDTPSTVLKAQLQEDNSAQEDAYRLRPDGVDVIHRFWRLPASEAFRIIGELNLLKEDEYRLPQVDRYTRVIENAKEQQLVDALIQRIMEAGY